MGLHLLLKLADPEASEIQLMPHFPQVGVADGVLALVVPQDVLSLVDRSSERQRLTHTLQSTNN